MDFAERVLAAAIGPGALPGFTGAAAVADADTVAMRDGCMGLGPLAIRGLQRADGPIAGEHDALGAEAVERVIDDRRKIVRRPAFARLHDDAGDFADDVAQSGQAFDVALPGVAVLGIDRAVA